ncbi:uridine phosphorylase [Salinisphaera sp. SPP-AMP-43]|uniref:uridine phosphorylase n=1 Tax=Salinisphaera sp. SPP-AMP-43 TaxID=3121288 RepID=UPI003C6E81BE
MVLPDDCQYHIALRAADLGSATTALLPGDPDRVEPLARRLAQAVGGTLEPLARHREFTSCRLQWAQGCVVICSTGIGGPSTAIATEELARLGITRFLRVGTTGAIQPHIEIGDLVISRAAVRLEGASHHYAPAAYPAVAGFDTTERLVAAARATQVPWHLGITASSDTFWPGQERYDSYSGYVRRDFQGSLAEWRALKVANFEMEAATLLTQCSVMGLEAGCLCGVIAQRVDSEVVDTSAYERISERWTQLLAKALSEGL